MNQQTIARKYICGGLRTRAKEYADLSPKKPVSESILKKDKLKVLGKGANAIVWKVEPVQFSKLKNYGFEGNLTTEKPIAMKIITSPDAAEYKEAKYGEELSLLNLGPVVYGEWSNTYNKQNAIFILMELINSDTVQMIERSSQEEVNKFAANLVEKIKRMVAEGYAHNDLHLGNIAYQGTNAILFDFGFVEYFGKINKKCQETIVLAQLYAALEICNANNDSLALEKLRRSPLQDEINALSSKCQKIDLNKMTVAQVKQNESEILAKAIESCKAFKIGICQRQCIICFLYSSLESLGIKKTKSVLRKI